MAILHSVGLSQNVGSHYHSLHETICLKILGITKNLNVGFWSFTTVIICPEVVY
jgi:hypothetical protein